MLGLSLKYYNPSTKCKKGPINSSSGAVLMNQTGRTDWKSRSNTLCYSYSYVVVQTVFNFSGEIKLAVENRCLQYANSRVRHCN